MSDELICESCGKGTDMLFVNSNYLEVYGGSYDTFNADVCRECFIAEYHMTPEEMNVTPVRRKDE